MTIQNKNNLVKSVGVGKLLFSSLASAGKSQLGVSYLNLEMAPASELQVCYAKDAKIEPGKAIANDVTVVINPFKSTAVQMNFVVGDLLPGNRDYVVFLAYSNAVTKTPGLITPLSDNKVAIDLNSTEILGQYAFPKLLEYKQDVTRVGQAQSKARQKFMFTVNLDNDSITKLMRNNTRQIYLQAMALSKDDFDRGVYENAILTKVNSITFTEPKFSQASDDLDPACAPSDAAIKVDSTGGKTVKATGETSSVIKKSGLQPTSGSGKSSKTSK